MEKRKIEQIKEEAEEMADHAMIPVNVKKLKELIKLAEKGLNNCD